MSIESKAWLTMAVRLGGADQDADMGRYELRCY